MNLRHAPPERARSGFLGLSQQSVGCAELFAVIGNPFPLRTAFSDSVFTEDSYEIGNAASTSPR